jgi:hypothetical protein
MCLPAWSSPAAQGPSSQTSQLLVFVGGTALGSEESTLQRTAEGWVVSGSGRLAPPLDLTTRRVTVRYDASWKPLELTVDALSRGSPFSIHTVFNGTNATNDVIQLGQPSQKIDTVSADALVLPNLFFSSYEALAARLAAMSTESTTLPAYIAPQAEIRVSASRLDTQTIETTKGTVRRIATRSRSTTPAPLSPPSCGRTTAAGCCDWKSPHRGWSSSAMTSAPSRHDARTSRARATSRCASRGTAST